MLLIPGWVATALMRFLPVLYWQVRYSPPIRFPTRALARAKVPSDIDALTKRRAATE